jgi:hypothetical protein
MINTAVQPNMGGKKIYVNGHSAFCLGTMHLVAFIIFHDGFDFLQVKPKSKTTFHLPFLNHKFIPIFKKND